MVLDIMHIASCPINSLPQAVTGALLGGAVTAMQQGMHMPAIQRGAVTWGGFTYLYAGTIVCWVGCITIDRPAPTHAPTHPPTLSHTHISHKHASMSNPHTPAHTLNTPHASQ